MKLICKVIAFGSGAQIESIKLRREILRKPLGMDFTEAELSNEVNQIHIGCFLDNNLVGILLLVKIDKFTVKMRQVAVNEDMQGIGVGKIMVQFAENWTLENDYGMIILNARATAVPFYVTLEYKIVSDEYLEVGIPHFSMRKVL